jgi:DNA-binding response OmpR family regulator/KaiC/GvpD/RAD55 family RecA-like ATPase
MIGEAPKRIPSGIEPVDKLQDGLETGQLYLVHGESAGKSLFGIKFLIEGLKRGENGALVIRYSPEDAVRRFARLGYDCLEDVYSGRLVILEYSDDIILQISRLRELTPVLRELEWLLGETKPRRLVFDPVASLVVGETGNLKSRVEEFSGWARSFGGTAVMIANGESQQELIEHLMPLVAESIKFELKETDDRATRFIIFEKTPYLPPQPIEVDPSRGIFLLGRLPFVKPVQQAEPVRKDEPEEQTQREAEPRPRYRPEVYTPETAPLTPLTIPPLSPDTEPRAATPEPLKLDSTFELEAISEGPLIQHDFSDVLESIADLELPEEVEAQAPGKPTQVTPEAAPVPGLTGQLDSLYEVEAETAEAEEGEQPATLFDAAREAPAPLVDISDSSSPLDLDEFSEEFDRATRPEPAQAAPPAPPRPEAETAQGEATQEGAKQVGATGGRRRRTRTSDVKIDSMIAARATEMLLRPPDSKTEAGAQTSQPVTASPLAKDKEGAAESSSVVDSKSFNVLVIDDDPESCQAVSQTLADYTVEVVHDGLSGLAKLISFKPDLIVLDIDLPIIDGFKVLEHIRQSLNMPIIVVSGLRVRASDRVMSSELGADYYLTKPFSVKELRQKARQLIARYRGIDSWITHRPMTERAAPAIATTEHSAAEPEAESIEASADQFTPYAEFTSEVERRVRAAMETGSPFSIVGCRATRMTAGGGRVALKMFELSRALIRDTDLISTNPRNDLVIMLADADAFGARAFISRLRGRLAAELNEEPSVWLRSFPELEEASGARASEIAPANGGKRQRRAGDAERDELKADRQHATAAEPPQPEEAKRPGARVPERPDLRESYLELLEHL